MRHEESRMQQSCVRWFRYQYPKYSKNLISVPNGGFRNAVEARIMVAEGATAGASDLILLIPNRDCPFLCIELKTAKGRQSEHQKAFEESVTSVGAKYVIVRSLDEFIDVVTAHLQTP